MLKSLLILVAGFIVSAPAVADGWHHHHHHDHGWHHGHHHHHYQVYEPVYYPPTQVYYAPAPVVRYYEPAPRYYGYYDRRSPEGMIGGAFGSIMGYQIGNGDPIAAGIGAAAGSWFGNGMGRW